MSDSTEPRRTGVTRKRRTALGISLGFITLLIIACVSLLNTTSGLHWGLKQAQSYIPGKLTITGLNGSLLGPISIEQLQYSFQGQHVMLNNLVLDWSPSALLYSTVKINKLTLTNTVIDISTPATPTPSSDPPSPAPNQTLAFNIDIDYFTLGPITIRQDDAIVLALEQLSLAASAADNRVELYHLNVQSKTFLLDIQGWFEPSQPFRLDIQTRWQLMPPDMSIVEGEGHLVGSMKELSVVQQWDEPAKAYTHIIFYDLLEQPHWEGDVVLSEFNSTKLQSHWPAFTSKISLHTKGNLEHTNLYGSYTLNYPDVLGDSHGWLDLNLNQETNGYELELEQLILNIASNNTEFMLRGQWDILTQAGEVGLSWKNLNWPLSAIEPTLQSKAGSLHFSGSPDRYHIKTAGDMQLPDVPDTYLWLVADGTPEQLQSQHLRIETLDGYIDGDVQLRWQPKLEWNGKLKGHNIDPGQHWPDWPGQIEFEIDTEGQLEGDELSTHFKLHNSQGQLRNYPFKLDSQGSFAQQQLRLSNLKLQSGSAIIEASGVASDTLDLTVLIEADDLHQLHPDASGSLSAQVSAHGPPRHPEIMAQISAQQLRFENYRLDQLHSNAHINLLDWQTLQLDIQALGLSDNQNYIKTLTLQSSGNAQANQLQLSLDANEMQLSSLLDGQWNDQAAQPYWSGEILNLNLNTPNHGQWQLNSPAALTASASEFSLETLCLEQDTAQLCLESQYTASTLHAQLDIQQLPLSTATTGYLSEPLDLAGTLNAQASASYSPQVGLALTSQLTLPPSQFTYRLNQAEEKTWVYQHIQASVDIGAGGLTAQLGGQFNQTDQVNAQIKLPNFNALEFDQHQSLSGQLSLAINDLSIIETLVPDIQNVQANLQSELTLQGTLFKPQVSGHSQFEGQFYIPRLNISVDDITLALDNQADRASYLLQAKMGDGRLKIAGNSLLSASAGWPNQLTISGNDLLVSSIPEARVYVSPKLTVRTEKNALWLDGELHIPQAKLQPKDTSSAATASNDVIIVSKQTPTEANLQLHNTVRLTLGPRVDFFGFGFEGKLGGDIRISEEPGQPTTASGELTIPEGRYRAYGQRLDVKNGRIIYVGGPLNNPGLDIDATRQINEVTAGLKVRGTLNQPSINLFSVPSMGQTDALSYLVLGRPIDQSSSDDGNVMAQAALALRLSGGDKLARSIGDKFGFDELRLDSAESGEEAWIHVGRYLSPRLYVAYGAGLMEAVNTFNIRYTISDHLQLKGESGEYQGADLIYKFER